MRTTITGTRPGARLAVGCASLTMLASLSVSACSGSAPAQTLPSASTTPLSPSGAASTTPADRASSTPSGSTSSGSTSSASGTPSAVASATPRQTASPVVTAAPATGGGGTAGFQDAPLLGLGAAAILAGAGSIAYRRKVIRNR